MPWRPVERDRRDIAVKTCRNGNFAPHHDLAGDRRQQRLRIARPRDPDATQTAVISV